MSEESLAPAQSKPSADDTSARDAANERDTGGGTLSMRTYLADQFGKGKLPDNEEPLDTLPADAQAELAKWRERVPKLASALKRRTEQAVALEAQIKDLKQQLTALDGSGGAGIAAREAHIEELEAKTSDLTSRYREAEVALHSKDLELGDLRNDLTAWKTKWQTLTQSLDSQEAQLTEEKQENKRLQELLQNTETTLRDQVALRETRESELEERAQQIEELQAQIRSLESRGERLRETTDLAHRQIEALGGDLSALRQRLRGYETDLETRSARIAALEQDLASTREQGEAAQQRHMLQMAEVQAEHSNRLRDIHAQTLLVFEALDDQYAAESLAAADAATAAREADAQAAAANLADLEQRKNSEQEALRAQQAIALENLERQHALREEELEAQCRTQREELSRVTDALHRAREASDTQLSRIDELRAHNEQIRIENTGLKSTNEQGSRSLMRQQSELTEARDAHAAQQRLVHELEGELQREQQALQEHVQRLETVRAEKDELTQLLDRNTNQLDSQQQAIVEIEDRLRETRQALIEQETRAQADVQALQQERAQREQFEAEVKRLEDCCEQANETLARRDQERRELSERCRSLETESKSAEQRHADVQQALEKLQGERDELSDSLQAQETAFEQRLRASTEALEERLRAKEAEFEQRLQDAVVEQDAGARLQQELESVKQQAQHDAQELTRERDALAANLLRLEEALQQRDESLAQRSQELAQQQQELQRTREQAQADSGSRASEVTRGEADVEHQQRVEADLAFAQSEVKRLQDLVRERTETLNRMNWEQDVVERAAQTDGPASERDQKMMLVLNQQLQGAQQENERLRAELREREERLQEALAQRAAEELTLLRGVGDKLAAQLIELGVTSLADVASLQPLDLEKSEHPLHPLLGRIQKDEWISQATDLLAQKGKKIA